MGEIFSHEDHEKSI